ncbi:MAG: tRNA uridine-5-carboxymethylaminomethyl(34) synthesis GTPase MnmE [Synergistaceae bacterium]|jgi:tRNA modification GTPase|nr:tRNA uridine-5-carboxymethylaminomethyl(34) synthesis GTPase MnmE [Synergistaceae bacterium]
MLEGGVIAAIATAWGESAIAILRLSGSGSVALADKFFTGRRRLADLPPRYMALGRLVDRSSGVESTVDQVLVVRFEAGSSYTGEESLEIHCHGGIAAVQRCLELLLGAGARPAAPGEFTKRAFLSGRIDLTQAEAVQSVIRSRSDAALASSERSLQGELSSRLANLADELTKKRAALEVRLDYPEEVDGQEADEISGDIAAIALIAHDLAKRCHVGVMLSGGLKIAIVGRPNVGKSALLNALVGDERAIVAETPGTTRDTVNASTIWRGLVMEFVDTAGIRSTDDEIEGKGIERTLMAMRGADICVVALDSSSPISDIDREIASSVAKPAVMAINKSDLPRVASDDDILALSGLGPIEKSVRTSAIKSASPDSGIDELKDAIFGLALGDVSIEEGYSATERTVNVIREAARFVDEAGQAIKKSAGVDVAGSLLASASEIISEQLGTDATEELLDAIFSTFCVGK